MTPRQMPLAWRSENCFERALFRFGSMVTTNQPVIESANLFAVFCCCELMNLAVFGCKNTMDDICVGCSRCMVGFNRKVGEFEKYQDNKAELIGILGCGGCPGMGTVPRLAQFGLWNSQLKEIPTKVHIAPCVTMQCPYAETIIKKIRDKTAVEVIEGTHPFMPENIFG